MSSFPFVVRQHTFERQHIRQYPAALSTHREDIAKLHAKSYTPREVDDGSKPGDLTIVAFHANAIPKECYEPLFTALYTKLRNDKGLTIGSIWIADQAAQGISASINDDRIGNDSHWWDHSRDILQMVNVYRRQMKRPIVAFGHSMGATQAVVVAHYHPRLFEAMVMMDPPMTMTVAETVGAMVQFSLRKPRTFESREAAAKFVRKSPFFKLWEPRVLEKYIEFAFHDAATVLHSDRQIKYRTTYHSEIRGLARPNPGKFAPGPKVSEVDRLKYPDVSLESPLVGPMYNPQTREAYAFLKSLRPATFFLLGKGSKVCPTNELEHRTKITGTDTGGSGGVEMGKVTQATIPGGHFLPLTNVDGTAKTAAEWIAVQVESFGRREAAFREQLERWSKARRQQLGADVQQVLEEWDGIPWDNPDAAPDGGRSKL